MRTLLVTLMLATPFALSVALAAEYEGPECVQIGKEAPYQAFGYTHIVVVRNTCDETVHCRVATDVDPQWQNVIVASGETGRVATRRGSPASAFETRARCRTQ